MRPATTDRAWRKGLRQARKGEPGQRHARAVQTTRGRKTIRREHEEAWQLFRRQVQLIIAQEGPNVHVV